MNEEEFITKFYSCDDEEQFLKDVYHNLNCLQQENQQLKIQISAREEEYRKLDETNKVLSQELTKDNILKQEHLKTCCGISIGDIPKLITQQKEFISYLENEIYSIEPKGTGINYNCEYDSEEDYISAMKEQSKLNTLKEILSKYKSIIGVLDEKSNNISS